MKTISLCCLVGLAVALGGCGSIRVVKKTQAGGEVALVGSQDKAREKAAEYMQAQCPSGYDVLEEGEAVVGSTMSGQQQNGIGVFGRPTTTMNATTEDKREWRIKYQCKGAPGAAPEQKAAEVRDLVIRF